MASSPNPSAARLFGSTEHPYTAFASPTQTPATPHSSPAAAAAATPATAAAQRALASQSSAAAAAAAAPERPSGPSPQMEACSELVLKLQKLQREIDHEEAHGFYHIERANLAPFNISLSKLKEEATAISGSVLDPHLGSVIAAVDSHIKRLTKLQLSLQQESQRLRATATQRDLAGQHPAAAAAAQPSPQLRSHLQARSKLLEDIEKLQQEVEQEGHRYVNCLERANLAQFQPRLAQLKQEALAILAADPTWAPVLNPLLTAVNGKIARLNNRRQAQAEPVAARPQQSLEQLILALHHQIATAPLGEYPEQTILSWQQQVYPLIERAAAAPGAASDRTIDNLLTALSTRRDQLIAVHASRRQAEQSSANQALSALAQRAKRLHELLQIQDQALKQVAPTLRQALTGIESVFEDTKSKCPAPNEPNQRLIGQIQAVLIRVHTLLDLPSPEAPAAAAARPSGSSDDAKE
jgi:hypothetical protein